MRRLALSPARPTPGSGAPDPLLDDETPRSDQPLDGEWLRALSIDLHGRPPLESERERWIGRPRAAYVRAALGTEEAWQHWLGEQLYYFMLIDRFRPVGTGLDELPAMLARGAISPRDALHRIALCTSFDLRNPGADTFVTVVMEQFCGIEVQRATRELEIGKTAYDGGTGVFLGEKATCQSDVIRIAVEHKQAARHLIEREHLRICRAPLSAKGRSKVVKEIHSKPRRLAEVMEDWFVSEAYEQRVERGAPMENHIWVRTVFVDLSGGLPGPDDVEALRSALDGLGDPAPLRSAVVRMLLASEGTRAPRRAEIGDGGGWVAATFQRLLGRAPSAKERAVFREVAVSGEDGPETVLYTILTSAEYEKP